MNSKREVVKDVIRGYLEEALGESEAYECACEIADEVFSILEISSEEQDKPVKAILPYRLPSVKLDGKSYFVDIRLKQLRNVQNPHEFFDFDNGAS